MISVLHSHTLMVTLIVLGTGWLSQQIETQSRIQSLLKLLIACAIRAHKGLGTRLIDRKELRAGAQAQRRQYIAGVGFLARCQIWKNHFTSNKLLFLRTRRGAIYPHCQICYKIRPQQGNIAGKSILPYLRFRQVGMKVIFRIWPKSAWHSSK